MGNIDRIIAAASSLDESRQARVLAFVEQLKAEQKQCGGLQLTADQARVRDEIAAALKNFRVKLAGYKRDLISGRRICTWTARTRRSRIVRAGCEGKGAPFDGADRNLVAPAQAGATCHRDVHLARPAVNRRVIHAQSAGIR